MFAMRKSRRIETKRKITIRKRWLEFPRYSEERGLGEFNTHGTY